MSGPYFYLTFDMATGVGVGSQSTSDPLPTPLPSGMMSCTQAEAYTPQQCQAVSGVILGYVPGVRAAQIKTIQQSSLKALSDPLSFTPSGASSPSLFSMVFRDWSLCVGRYTKYVVYAQPLSSPFGFKDIDSLFVPFALADLKNFFDAAEQQIVTVEGKEINLISQINAVTSTSNNDTMAISTIQSIVW